MQALIGSFGLVTLNSTSTTDSFVSFEQKYAISAPKATACNSQHARHRRGTVSPLRVKRNLLRNHLGESHASHVPVQNHLSRSLRHAREGLLGLTGARSRSAVCLNRSDVALLVLAQHEERKLGALRPDGLHSIPWSTQSTRANNELLKYPRGRLPPRGYPEFPRVSTWRYGRRRSGAAATVGRSQHMASIRGPCRGCRVDSECTEYSRVDSECIEYSSMDWAHYRR